MPMKCLKQAGFPKTLYPQILIRGMCSVFPRRFVYGTESKRHFLIRYEIHGRGQASVPTIHVRSIVGTLACPRPRTQVLFWCDLRCNVQIGANEETHVIGAVGAANRFTLPPPVPDVLRGQTEIECRSGRGIVAIAEPEAGTDTTPG